MLVIWACRLVSTVLAKDPISVALLGLGEASKSAVPVSCSSVRSQIPLVGWLLCVFFIGGLGLAISTGGFDVLALAGFSASLEVGLGLAVLADGFGWLGGS